MVEVFLAAGLTSTDRNAPLAEAVRGQRENLARLLIEQKGLTTDAAQPMFLIDTE